MLFNSYEFIYIFFPCVFFLYWWSTRYNYVVPKVILSISSVVFYSVMALKFLPLMLFSICTNYSIGTLLSQRRWRFLLIFGVLFNISIIFYFKYCDFFLKITDIDYCISKNVIPLGISFYTFTQIAYLVDAYKNKIDRNNTFLNYFLFVTYFPHLIAGPILHHKNMISQFSNHANYHIDYKNIFTGILFFSIGLAKKVLIADYLIEYVTPVFDAISEGKKLTPLECWCGAIAYTFQLYFDFSGYSDMAIGLSKFFNFDLPFNFNAPYQATSMIDFWRRWHMSLSSFLRDYLYIPLGGNRKGLIRQYMNIMITMVIGGLWHGANWTFLLWGGYHGLLLVINHLIKKTSMISQHSLPTWLKPYGVFFLALLGWIMFRSANLSSALWYYRCLFDFSEYWFLPDRWIKLSAILPFTVDFKEMPYFFGRLEVIVLICLLLLARYGVTTQKIAETVHSLKNNKLLLILFTIILVMFTLSLYYIDRQSEFIYFQF